MFKDFTAVIINEDDGITIYHMRCLTYDEALAKLREAYPTYDEDLRWNLWQDFAPVHIGRI